jgi:apolipoprotein N-acyltransferase
VSFSYFAWIGELLGILAMACAKLSLASCITNVTQDFYRKVDNYFRWISCILIGLWCIFAALTTGLQCPSLHSIFPRRHIIQYLVVGSSILTDLACALAIVLLTWSHPPFRSLLLSTISLPRLVWVFLS